MVVILVRRYQEMSGQETEGELLTVRMSRKGLTFLKKPMR